MFARVPIDFVPSVSSAMPKASMDVVFLVPRFHPRGCLPVAGGITVLRKCVVVLMAGGALVVSRKCVVALMARGALVVSRKCVVVLAARGALVVAL